MFFLKKHGEISRAYDWNELLGLGLSENTKIWTKELCPLENSVENCTKHWETLKDYKKNQKDEKVHQKENNFQQNSSSKKNWVYGGRFTLVLIFLWLLSPYIFSLFDQGQKKEETINGELEFLGGKVRVSKSTKYYEVKEVNQDLGKKGKCYIIDLKSAYDEEMVLFKAGEYVISDPNNSFAISFDDFMANVYYRLKDEGVNCQLYIKGSAYISGHTTFLKNIDERYGSKEGFTKVEYLRALDKEYNFFTNEVQIKWIGDEYSNSELPILRGKFIEYWIKQKFKGVTPIILEGGVQGKTSNASLRNAYLYLFVESKNS